MSTVILLAPGTTSWVVPSDWNSASNSIECIGGGGGGGGGNSTGPAAGGGGAAYSKTVNVPLAPFTVINCSVGAAGAGGTTAAQPTAGGASWFGSTTATSASVLAAGGGAAVNWTGTASTTLPGQGGKASACIGDIYLSGGNGGGVIQATYTGAGGGGGGSAGPHGQGANGGANDAQLGAGGGGADGGNPGVVGSGVGSGTGETGNGGNNRNGSGGGAGGSYTGSDGTNGGGGGGGYTGGQGSYEPIWTATSNGATAGPGSGSGGGQFATLQPIGAYGGGGGGAASGVGIPGQPGLIVITYTPLTVVIPTTGGNSGGSAISSQLQTAQAGAIFGVQSFGTIVDVINDALNEIGAELISDPSEPSPQAVRAATLYTRVVRAELRAHAWSCAMDRAVLAANPFAPSFGYRTSYPLPPNFLRLWQLGDIYMDYVLTDYVGKDESYFAIEGKNILCNETSPLKIRFIKDISQTPNLWDALLREVIALRLGLKLIPSLLKSDSKYQIIQKEYESIIRRARRINAIELPPTPEAESSWVIGRL